MKAIGYDAIVIDRRDNFMLVTGARESLTKKNQGLVLRDSSHLMTIQDRTTPAAGIVEVVSVWDNFAVIRVIIGKSSLAKSGNPAGLKIAFPRKTKNNPE
ncbi:MAG: hypothetical protein EBT45_08730 [Alphaproteobacteria bacterium]|nr:hypothetical protein [Alphaproteobacteria bacterium]